MTYLKARDAAGRFAATPELEKLNRQMDAGQAALNRVLSLHSLGDPQWRVLLPSVVRRANTVLRDVDKFLEAAADA